MKSLLVDTGPLVALCRPNDQFHARAMSELTRLGRGPKLVCLPVLTETYFFLSVAVQRKRLWALIEEEIVRPFTERGEVLVNERALRWLQKYDDHNPDFADAYILSLSPCVREVVAPNFRDG